MSSKLSTANPSLRDPDVVQNGLALSLAAPQDLRPRRVQRAAGEPPDRVQPPSDGRRRHLGEAAGSPRRRPDRAARQGTPGASGVSGLAQVGSVQEAGAGVAGAAYCGPQLWGNAAAGFMNIELACMQAPPRVQAYRMIKNGKVAPHHGRPASGKRRRYCSLIPRPKPLGVRPTA
jgi:hypothetical protein